MHIMKYSQYSSKFIIPYTSTRGDAFVQDGIVNQQNKPCLVQEQLPKHLHLKIFNKVVLVLVTAGYPHGQQPTIYLAAGLRMVSVHG